MTPGYLLSLPSRVLQKTYTPREVCGELAKAIRATLSHFEVFRLAKIERPSGPALLLLVRKLRALSGNNPSANEATSAGAMADRLMEEHRQNEQKKPAPGPATDGGWDLGTFSTADRAGGLRQTKPQQAEQKPPAEWVKNHGEKPGKHDPKACQHCHKMADLQERERARANPPAPGPEFDPVTDWYERRDERRRKYG